LGVVKTLPITIEAGQSKQVLLAARRTWLSRLRGLREIQGTIAITTNDPGRREVQFQVLERLQAGSS
jgi:hypothetical protein